MNTPAAFEATYSNWRVVRGRGVIQLVFEIPIENEKLAYDVLGGMPTTNEVWCAVARLHTPPASTEN